MYTGAHQIELRGNFTFQLLLDRQPGLVPFQTAQAHFPVSCKQLDIATETARAAQKNVRPLLLKRISLWCRYLPKPGWRPFFRCAFTAGWSPLLLRHGTHTDKGRTVSCAALVV